MNGVGCHTDGSNLERALKLKVIGLILRKPTTVANATWSE